MLKGREVRERLRRVDVAPQVKVLMEALAEDNNALEQAVNELAKLNNRLIDQMLEQTAVNTNIRRVLEQTVDRKVLDRILSGRYDGVKSEEIPKG